MNDHMHAIAWAIVATLSLLFVLAFVPENEVVGVDAEHRSAMTDTLPHYAPLYQE